MATKSEIAAHLFISERQLTNIISANPGAPVAVGRGGWDMDEMRKWYIQVLKQGIKKAKSSSDDAPLDDDELDEGQSYKKRKSDLELQKLQADVQAKIIKNNKDLNQWAPISLLEFTVSKLAGNLASRFDGLIPRLKISCAELTPQMMEQLETELIKFRNECSDVEIDLSDYDPCDFESDCNGNAPTV